MPTYTSFFLFFCFYLFAISSSHAQTRSPFIGVELGTHVLFSNIRSTDRIRPDISNRSTMEREEHSLTSYYTANFVGLKTGMYSLNNKFSFSGGVAYSRITGELTNDLNVFAADFFFYRLREEGTITEYVTLIEIFQDTDYITIPLEMRFFPFAERKVNFYARAGASVNIMLNTDGRVTFYDALMNKREKEVLETLNQPGDVNILFHLAGGVRYGKRGKPSVGVELAVPSFVITRGATGAVEPNAGVGIQFNFELPLNVISNE